MSEADSPASLTQQEARERAELVEVDRYDITVDLRELLEGERWRATSSVAFRCSRPGVTTFVDIVGEVVSARLNDVELDVTTHARGRLPLPPLEAENTLVVSSVQADTTSGNAVMRSVDPQDKLVYVWSSFEPDGAKHAWACFDQPDLKAVHGFQVSAPKEWTVLSNCAPEVVLDRDDGGRLWTFQDTPPLSTYVTVVNAGPFHELREERGGHSLGLYCRQSLRSYLERDAEELFRVTEQGLAFFGERFARPFPQERYDQVFVPEFAGAMENWGCVTWTDTELHRNRPTYAQRAFTAVVVLHEMAHMWFGDLVTMRWWDDLWLNEAFASFASGWASVGATEYADAWAAFLIREQLAAYQQDAGPASHPIRNEVPDVAHAFASFDSITYYKGQAVLRQLMAFLTEERFTEGLRRYFADHAWGNATLDDLMTALGAAAERDLSEWTTAWLDRRGTDTISLIGTTLLTSSPDGGEPRRHALRVGAYQRTEDGLEAREVRDVETVGTSTPLLDLPTADLHLVNDGDLTFASVRTDERSLQVLLSEAAQLDDPVNRALAAGTAWDMLFKGELSTADFLDCTLGLLASEPGPGVAELLFDLAVKAAEVWSPAVLVPRRLARVADVAAARADEPELKVPALHALAASATSSDHFDLLDDATGDDADLAWRVLARRASLGQYDETAVEELLQRDPDPDAQLRAWSVAAARPTEDAKAEAWRRVWEQRVIGPGVLTDFGRCFWRPWQVELLLPWADRYLDEITNLSPGFLAAGRVVRQMRPATCDAAWLARAQDVADTEGIAPAVRTQLVIGIDFLTRVLNARA